MRVEACLVPEALDTRGRTPVAGHRPTPLWGGRGGGCRDDSRAISPFPTPSVLDTPAPPARKRQRLGGSGNNQYGAPVGSGQCNVHGGSGRYQRARQRPVPCANSTRARRASRLRPVRCAYRGITAAVAHIQQGEPRRSACRRCRRGARGTEPARPLLATGPAEQEASRWPDAPAPLHRFLLRDFSGAAPEERRRRSHTLRRPPPHLAAGGTEDRP